jgi:hypothetical protein
LGEVYWWGFIAPFKEGEVFHPYMPRDCSLRASRCIQHLKTCSKREIIEGNAWKKLIVE